MSTRKTLYNPENSKDLEDLMNYFHSVDSDDEAHEQFQSAESLEVALVPPDDAMDSDQDDAHSDDDMVPSIRDLGKGILSQKVDVFAVNKNKEKSPIKTGIQSPLQIRPSDQNWEESDDETLADKQKRLKIQIPSVRKSTQKVNRAWQEITLEPREQRIELLKENTPCILTDILERNMAPIDLFKVFFSEDIITTMCIETKRYADQKGFHGDKIEGKSLGSSVTEKLCLNFLEQNSTIFLDNYFTSIPLLETLTANKLYCVGTVRSDRVEKAPLKDLKKDNRGSHYTIHDSTSNITLTRWHDNSQVTVISNVQDKTLYQTKGSCKRWSKKDKSAIQVDQPSLVHLYTFI
ncbi:unnamed protein product [Acanthoscelides obtectus]|uniref:PiggyBac transposable element-derived protein domain-containing protein n=1 Tax=Acanthoscelides obtectus TaxID=200917 RepID=A0A9P0PBQ4_ACAOB|nr:unnamed protein product [Acanthoscelides obtectus]CAK1634378.1 PiggyBac transposable element-derived protein 2 [Acanthoscelides obtectus]